MVGATSMVVTRSSFARSTNSLSVSRSTRLRAAAFQSRIGEHILGEMTETVGFRAERVQVACSLFRIGHHAGGEHFGIHLESGQRRAQFMSDGRNKGAARWPGIAA